MRTKIRIGVLGCANIAKRSVIPEILTLPQFELIAVASRTMLKANEFSSEFNCEAIVGYDEIIKRTDIDALYIPLPTGLHEEWTIKALNNNKHVLIEKSLAMNLDSAKRILEVAKKKKLVLMEDFMFRYHSQHQYVFDNLRNSKIGDMRLFKSNFGFPPLDKSNFRYCKDLGGGSILDAAAYTVNVSRWFLGNDLEVNSANLFYDAKNDICVHGSATLFSHETGITSMIAFGFDNFYQCNYEIWGSKGIIKCNRAFTPPSLMEPKMILRDEFGVHEKTLPADNQFKNILEEFSKCIYQKKFERYQDDIYHQSRILTEIENKGIKKLI